MESHNEKTYYLNHALNELPLRGHYWNECIWTDKWFDASAMDRLGQRELSADFMAMIKEIGDIAGVKSISVGEWNKSRRIIIRMSDAVPWNNQIMEVLYTWDSLVKEKQAVGIQLTE